MGRGKREKRIRQTTKRKLPMLMCFSEAPAAAGPKEAKPPAEWDSADVGSWVREQGATFAKYAESFEGLCKFVRGLLHRARSNSGPENAGRRLVENRLSKQKPAHRNTLLPRCDRPGRRVPDGRAQRRRSEGARRRQRARRKASLVRRPVTRRTTKHPSWRCLLSTFTTQQGISCILRVFRGKIVALRNKRDDATKKE